MEKDNHRVQTFRSVTNVKAIVGQDQNLIGGGDRTWENWEGVYCCSWLVLRFRLSEPQTECTASIYIMMNCKTEIVASLRHVARNLRYGTEATHKNLSYESR